MGSVCSSHESQDPSNAAAFTKYQRALVSLDQPLPAAEQHGPSKAEKEAQRAAAAAAARERFLGHCDAKDAAAVERMQAQRNHATRHVLAANESELPGLAQSLESGHAFVAAHSTLTAHHVSRTDQCPRGTQRSDAAPGLQSPQASACTYDLLRSASLSTSMCRSAASDEGMADDSQNGTPSSLGDLTPKLRRLRGAPPRDLPALAL